MHQCWIFLLFFYLAAALFPSPPLKMISKGSIYEDLPSVPRVYPQEVFTKLLSTENTGGTGMNGFSIERIVSTNHTTEYVSQDEDEWVMLVQGHAKLSCQQSPSEEEVIHSLQGGDFLFIPRGTRHRVIETSSDPCAIW